MDHLRTPIRHKPEQAPSDSQGWIGYALGIVLLAITIVGAVQAHRKGYRINIGVPPAAEQQAAQPQVIYETRYLCTDSVGRQYTQLTPCPRLASATPPAATQRTYESPRPYAQTAPVNPNQALLDAADARYQREVNAARRADRQLQTQIAGIQSRPSASAPSASCEVLCEKLQDLRARMRAGYPESESRRLHDKQNSLFKQLGANGCGGCFG